VGPRFGDAGPRPGRSSRRGQGAPPDLPRPRRSALPRFPSLGERRVSVVVIGLNHRSPPLDLLERVTIGDAALPKALHDLVSRSDVSEAVALSTSNTPEA